METPQGFACFTITVPESLGKDFEIVKCFSIYVAPSPAATIGAKIPSEWSDSPTLMSYFFLKKLMTFKFKSFNGLG